MSRRTLSALRRSHAPVFAALGDPTRLVLITRLSEGDASSIAQLTVGTRLTRQAVTKHLRVLENAGIVRGSRQGRESIFALESAPLRTARTYLDSLSEHWDQSLARLKAFVEER